MFCELCGETSTLKNFILVTNMWNTISAQNGEASEKELSSNVFKLALQRGAQMARHNGTLESAHYITREITKNHPAALSVQRELVDQREDIIHITAAAAVNRKLDEQTRKAVQEDMTQLLKEENEHMRKELEEEKRKVQRLEARMKEVEQAKRQAEVWLEQEVKERERAEAEYKRQLADLTHRLHDETNTSMTHQTRSEQEIKPQDHEATVVMMPPHPTPYVRVLFCLVAHDG